MSEQRSPAPKRTYRKARRAEHEWRTRERIVDAAEHLHSTLGPARTTVSAVAGRAGVTRATVYRHFPTEESLFLACSRQWWSRQQPPEPDAWATVEDPIERLRAGLADIYRFYRRGEQMLVRIHRDVDVVPPVVVAGRRSRERLWLDALVGPRSGRRKVEQAAVAHAIAFTTWQSLCGAQGLSHTRAVELMVGMVEHISR